MENKMVEIKSTGLELLSDETITTEILGYKARVGTGIIEIGKRLIEMKKRIGHGNWLNYLKDEVDFTQVTASKFMRIAEEFSNQKSPFNLGTEKLFLLLDVPAEQREEFINTPHTLNGVDKTVDEMSVRDLQKVIKEKEQLETINQELQDLVVKTSTLTDKLIEEKTTLELNFTEAQNTIKFLETIKPAEPQIKIKEIIKEVEVIKQVVPDEIKRELSQKTTNLINMTDYVKEAEDKIKKLESDVAKLSEYKGRIDEYNTAKDVLMKHQQELHNIRLRVEDTSKFIRYTSEIKDFMDKRMTPMLTTMHLPDTNNVIKTDVGMICDTLQNWIFIIKQKFQIQ